MTSLNILVFGANGRTGKLFTEMALERNHSVTAVVRRPEEFRLVHKNLSVVKGDVLAPHTFQNEIKDKDAVVSALGIQGTKPTTVFSNGVLNILRVMELQNVKRFVAVSALAVEIGPDIPVWQGIFTKYILQRILKNLYADTRLMEQVIRDSAADWTIVRPPRLTNQEMTGKYRMAVNTYLSRPFSISRADTAHYILQHLEDKEVFKAIVEIGY